MDQQERVHEMVATYSSSRSSDEFERESDTPLTTGIPLITSAIADATIAEDVPKNDGMTNERTKDRSKGPHYDII